MNTEVFLLLCVCVCGKEELFIQVKEEEEEERNQHRQLLSKSRQKKYIEYIKEERRHITNNIFHTTNLYTYIDQCGMRKKTTDKHTETNYNSRMKEMYNTRKERKKKEDEETKHNELVN